MDSLQQAVHEAFETYSDDLFRHAFFRLSDRERAVELVQECFLRTWEYVANGGSVREYRPFLYRTLNNLIIDAYRKRKTVSLDAMLENEDTATFVEAELLRDEFDLFEDRAISFDAHKALEALERLPENHRSILVLRYVDGLSPTEIASMLEVNENTISVRIHRAVRKLRELISSTTPIQP